MEATLSSYLPSFIFDARNDDILQKYDHSLSKYLKLRFADIVVSSKRDELVKL